MLAVVSRVTQFFLRSFFLTSKGEERETAEEMPMILKSHKYSSVTMKNHWHWQPIGSDS